MKFKHLVALVICLPLMAINPVCAGQAKALSRSTYSQLKQIEVLRDAGRHRQALAQLRALAEKVGNLPYASAVVRQQLVYTYLQLNDTQSAWRVAVAVLDGGQLADEADRSLTYLAAQIAFEREDYRGSIQYAERWLSRAPAPAGEVHFLLGYSHYQLGRLKSAKKHLKRATALETPAPEDWSRVLLAVYLESKHYGPAESLLQHFVATRPDNPLWWQYLTHVYLEQEKDDEALAVLVLTQRKGLLEDADLERVLQLYSHRGIPEKAARLLQAWLANGRLQKNHANLKLQFRLWHLAREHGLAEQALDQAAGLAANGEDYLILGRLLLDREQWYGAGRAIQSALDQGIGDTSMAQLLKGIIAVQCQAGETAGTALAQARQNTRLASEADYWIGRLKRMDGSTAPEPACAPGS